MNIRLVWLLTLLCCAMVVGELWYVGKLTADAPTPGCEIFVNKLDCERDVVLLRERQL
jgi:hypothetical protein